MKFTDILNIIRSKFLKDNDEEYYSEEVVLGKIEEEINEEDYREFIKLAVGYLYDDIGIIDELYNRIQDLLIKNLNSANEIDEHIDHPLERLNYHLGALAILQRILMFVNDKIGVEDDSFKEEDICNFVKAEDFFIIKEEEDKNDESPEEE